MRRIFNFVFLLYFIIIIFIKSNYVSFIPKALDPNILIAIMGAIMLFNPYYSYGKLMSRKYGIMGLIVILSLIHLLLFNPFETDAWVYLIARLITFSAIIFFIELNEERVTNKFLSNIIIAILIIFGLSIITSGFSTGSLTLGFKNRNDTGSFLILMLAYSYFNFFNPGFISKRIKGFFEIILAIAVVLTGSRSALLMLVIMIFYFLWFEKRYSVFKKLILGISILLFPLFLNSLFTADYTTGIDRFESGATVYRKNIEIKAAKETIRNSPLKGYGIQKYGWSDENAVTNYSGRPIMGPHNGFLQLLIMYGIPIGGIIILSLLIFLIKTQYYFGKYKIYLFDLFMLSALFMGNMGENLLTGINESSVILFWFFYARIKNGMAGQTRTDL